MMDSPAYDAIVGTWFESRMKELNKKTIAKPEINADGK
jgi:hypothetical protein